MNEREDGRTEITDTDLNNMYDEMLDEQGEITIGSLVYYPSTVLERVDPIAYRIGLSEYYDSISDEYYCEDME